MERTYNKLIRDRIPEIIHQQGESCDVVILNNEEYRQALRAKVMEEAQEVATAEGEDLAGEIADLYEVLDALLESHALSATSIKEIQSKKRAERGGFTQRLFLQKTY